MVKTYCTAAVGLIDVSASTDASYSCTDKWPFVDLTRFNRDPTLQFPKLITFEQDYFWLDGSHAPLTPSGPDIPYVYWSTSMSDESGNYTGAPLTVRFTRQHSSVGLGLRFHEPTNDYADVVYITWYNAAGAQISAGEFHPDSWSFDIEHPVEEYQSIKIEFRHTAKPYRYIKMIGIVFGIGREFGEGEVIAANVLEQINPISVELPYNTLSLTLHSKEDDFNPLNPQGMFAYLQEKQPIDVGEYANGKSIYIGRYYIDKWEAAENNSILITAISALGVADQSDYRGGIYFGANATSLIQSICDSAAMVCYIDPAFAGVTVSGHLPITTHRQALQQVAIAIGAIVDDSRSDKINIFPPPANPSKSVAKSRKFIGENIKLKPIVTGVSVVSHTYKLSTELREFLNEELPAGDHEIVFHVPINQYTITGGTVVSATINRAVIRTNGGLVTFKAKEYVDTQKVNTVSQDLPPGAMANVLVVDSATLISDSAAPAVALRLFDYYQNRYENTFRLITDEEIISDHVVVDSLRDEKLRGIIESMDINLSGGFISQVILTGRWIETFNGSYTGEFRTGEWQGVL